MAGTTYITAAEAVAFIAKQKSISEKAAVAEFRDMLLDDAAGLFIFGKSSDNLRGDITPISESFLRRGDYRFALAQNAFLCPTAHSLVPGGIRTAGQTDWTDLCVKQKDVVRLWTKGKMPAQAQHDEEGPATSAVTENNYKARAEKIHKETGKYPSLKEDWINDNSWGRNNGLKREAVREFRRKHLPDAAGRRGAPKKKIGPK